MKYIKKYKKTLYLSQVSVLINYQTNEYKFLSL